MDIAQSIRLLAYDIFKLAVDAICFFAALYWVFSSWDLTKRIEKLEAKAND